MKKVKYILLMAFTMGLMAISCNDDPVKPLGGGGGGGDDDPPIIIDTSSYVPPIIKWE